ncbi:MAG: hypothetical protein JSS94_06970 [Bacteroidetes bacterium]|nr:hypothetical protein [Bacteroidota bacterium]
MQRAILFFIIGTTASFVANYYFFGSQEWKLDLYYSIAFGLGWGLSYFVDHPEWPLFKKLGISFLGIALLVGVGLLLFDFVLAVPAIIKFSTVFVAYYLIASFKASKSLRQ